MPSKVASEIQERLAAVRETAGELQRNQAELMRQMREAFRDMRAMRERPLTEHAQAGQSSGPSPADPLVVKYHLTPCEVEVAPLLSGGACCSRGARRSSPHGLSTVRDADRIVVLEDGAIAKIGTHDELIARGGLCAGLVEKQRKGLLGEDRGNAGRAAWRECCALTLLRTS